LNKVGCEALSKYLLNENCQLESLNLASNRTGHFGAKMIARAVNKNRTLKHLDMTRNDIDDNGLRYLTLSRFLAIAL
jgi:Ran GTPase-activating protein (RanGAP) involved in mRNA processing and transport